MKFLIQRALDASCEVDGEITGAIDTGYMVLIGVSREDSEKEADKLIRKMLGLRIFGDENGKTNLSLKSIGGSILLISQFTLYADAKHGNRPSFSYAGEPERAERLYEYIISRCREELEGWNREAGETIYRVETGIFGAEMKIHFTNDGPFTIILDSDEL